MGDRRILVSAAGINNGGGFVLFESLVRSLKTLPLKIALDSRLSSHYESLVHDGVAVVVKKSFFSRILANIRLSLEGRRQDVLFCFNSLPPLVRSKAFTVTYIHSPQFVGLHKNSSYAFRERVRFFVEIIWLRSFHRNSDILWVQTESMKVLLVRQLKGVRVEVVPFLDDSLFDLYSSKVSPIKNNLKKEYSFFYPASFTGHKNHIILTQAFRKLAKSGLNVNLTLTLSDGDFSKLIGGEPCDNIFNIGVVEREQVIARMKSSSALIFPSKAETFGIPLIEASALGLPVIASELDFVRDVCVPVETFDANSSESIAGAVARFIGEDHKAAYAQFLSADEFTSRLYKL